MAIPQLTYPLDYALPFEGSLVDGSFDTNIVSASNVAAASFFGRACLQVLDFEDRFVQPTTIGGVFLGILVHSHAIEQSQVTAGGAGLPVNHPGGILRKGRIWVVVEEDIVTTDDVFYRFDAPGALPEAFGRWRSDLDTDGAQQVTQARWLTAASAGGLAKLEINLP